MKIGFIGAGKMGFTMGRHLADYSRLLSDESDNRIIVSGFYSRNLESAKEAAKFTDTKYYVELSELIRECDVLFITTPDGEIEKVAMDVAPMFSSRGDVILVHTSGALSSQVFSGMGSNVYGYSVHPIYAVSSKTESYHNFKDAFITIEGHDKYIEKMKSLFADMGHSVKVMASENKAKYHGAAVCASNLVVALFHMAANMLYECGFNEKEASDALMPLFINNAYNISKMGYKAALTGPVSRGDVYTIKKHLSVLDDDNREIYRLLSKKLVDICRSKNNNCDDMDIILKS